MAKAILLVAQVRTHYGGREVVPGEVFEATPIDAAALTYRHRAIFAPKDAIAQHEPEPARTKRQYRRRDMVAEP